MVSASQGNNGSGPPRQAVKVNQLEGLSTLLDIERSIRRAVTFHELYFIIVNELLRLVPYRQAAICRMDAVGIMRVEAISGLTTVDQNVPFIHWLKDVAGYCYNLSKDSKEKIIPLSPEGMPDEIYKDWHDWSAPHACWCPLFSPKGELLAGIWVSYDAGWKEADKKIVENLCETFGHALWALQQNNKRPWQNLSWRIGRRKKIIAAAIIAILCFPVRQTVLAPFEVTARDPWVATAPIDGVIKEVTVIPNQQIKKGDVIFRLDDTLIKNDFLSVSKARDSAMAELHQASQKAISSYDESNSAEVALLRLEVKQKQYEYEYARAMLDKIEVKSDIDGIAIFADEDDWIGKPVQVGQQVMKIAEPTKVEVQANLALDDAIAFPALAPVKMYLHSSPLGTLKGSVQYYSYEAQDIGAGKLAYKLKIYVNRTSKDIRIGLKGTAKVYGYYVPLGYYLLRRPLIYLKQLFIL